LKKWIKKSDFYIISFNVSSTSYTMYDILRFKMLNVDEGIHFGYSFEASIPFNKLLNDLILCSELPVKLRAWNPPPPRSPPKMRRSLNHVDMNYVQKIIKKRNINLGDKYYFKKCHITLLQKEFVFDSKVFIQQITVKNDNGDMFVIEETTSPEFLRTLEAVYEDSKLMVPAQYEVE